MDAAQGTIEEQELKECRCGCGGTFPVRRGRGRPRDYLDGHRPHRVVATGNGRARPRHGEPESTPPELEHVDWHVTDGHDPDEEYREEDGLLWEQLFRDVHRGRPFVVSGLRRRFTGLHNDVLTKLCALVWIRAIGLLADAEETGSRTKYRFPTDRWYSFLGAISWYGDLGKAEDVLERQVRPIGYWDSVDASLGISAPLVVEGRFSSTAVNLDDAKEDEVHEIDELRDRIARLEEVVRFDMDERIAATKRVRSRIHSDERIEETVTRWIESANELLGYDSANVLIAKKPKSTMRRVRVKRKT